MVNMMIKIKPRTRYLIAGIALALCLTGSFVAGTTAVKPEQVVQERLLDFQNRLLVQERELNAASQAAQQRIDVLAAKIAQMNTVLLHLETWQQTLGDMEASARWGQPVGFHPASSREESFVPQPSVGIQALFFGLDLLSGRLERKAEDLRQRADVIANQGTLALFAPSGWPTDSRTITSHRGYRKDPYTKKRRWHSGVDIDGDAGDPIYAVAPGVVSWAGNRTTYGGLVEVSHASGYISRYAHTSVNLVAVGDYVRRGQAIARVGSSGRVTGASLHFEILQDGKSVNPLPLITGRSEQIG